MNSTIRRRAEEEDEEVMMFWLPAMYLLMSNGGIEKRVRHTSSQYGEDKIREILGGHEKNSLVAFRMEPNIFREIATYLRTEHLLRDTRGITVEEKLGHFLYMLSHNASYEDLQHEFHHSGETIHRHIQSVFNIIPCLTYRFLKQPTGVETHWKISTDTRFFPYFKDCLGAIDGTHVPITISQDRQAPYRNRKGTLSQNVMVVCDFDLNFSFLSSGWEGSATDARVLRSAMLRGFNVPHGKYYLVDGGYANTPSFLAPYRGVRYHLKEYGHGQQRPRNYKELFNHRHAILRNHIERAIGVLKKRFPILKVGTHHPIENQVKIPAAAVVFHNIIWIVNGDEGWLDRQGSNISPEHFIDVPEATMIGRGSPRFNLIQAATAQRKPSPKISRDKKKKASPKVVLHRPRASCNAGLEKALVHLLHDHNNDCYRGQNGWSTEAWNRIVKLFHENFPYVNLTKVQIQDKEKELKREYRVLKEARKQSGASWDDKLCRIEGDDAVWEKIISSHPKAKKFRNKSFPLFEALGELYDGHTAEGTLNFTSIAPSQVPVTQPSQVSLAQPSRDALTQPSQATLTTFSSSSHTTFSSCFHTTFSSYYYTTLYGR